MDRSGYTTTGVQQLLKNQNYLNNKLDVALKETFIKMDEIMQTPEGKEELKTLLIQQKEAEIESLKIRLENECKQKNKEIIKFFLVIL